MAATLAWRSRSHGPLPLLWQVRETFAKFDKDGNGYVDARELSKALRDLGLEVDHAQALGILIQFDKSGDGKLDYIGEWEIS